jgi:hypothetical protein
MRCTFISFIPNHSRATQHGCVGSFRSTCSAKPGNAGQKPHTLGESRESNTVRRRRLRFRPASIANLPAMSCLLRTTIFFSLTPRHLPHSSSYGGVEDADDKWLLPLVDEPRARFDAFIRSVAAAERRLERCLPTDW